MQDLLSAVRLLGEIRQHEFFWHFGIFFFFARAPVKPILRHRSFLFAHRRPVNFVIFLCRLHRILPVVVALITMGVGL